MEKKEGPGFLQAFAEELEQYEKLIANEAKSLPKAQKSRRNLNGQPELTAAERQKASLIQRFVFPSDAESMIHVLLYIKSQTDILASRRPDYKTGYWMQLWKERAAELYEKVKILAAIDGSAYKAYADILRNERKIKRSSRRQVFLAGGLLLAALCVGLILLSPAETAEEANKTDADQTEEAAKIEREQNPPYAVEHFTFSLPDYWVEKGSGREFRQFYAETGGKVAMLTIGYPMDNEPVTLDALYADNENMIRVTESWFPECRVTGYKDFESDYGVKGVLYSYTAVYESKGSLYDMSGKSFCFPSVEDNRWFFVVINCTDNTDLDYQEDFMKLLASIRQTLH